MTENEISHILVGIFIKVHSKLGPGLLESVYETAICFELTRLSINYQRQPGIAIWSEGVKMDIGFRADIIVDQKVIVEIKSVEALNEIHLAQVLTYLKLSKCKVGLLINFNVLKLVDGLKRVVNNY